MKRRFSAFAAALVMVLLLVLPCTVDTVQAADLDYIHTYDITVTPQPEDGSLYIEVHLVWEVLDDGPVKWVQIGIPNGSIRRTEALSDNIKQLSFDNSFMRVDFTRGYNDGELIDFSYAWEQEYMYKLDGTQVSYKYTPGWFDEAKIGQMSITWMNDPALPTPTLTGTGGTDVTEIAVEGGTRYEAAQLTHGAKLHVSAIYDHWPTELFWENSQDNIPDSHQGGHSSSIDFIDVLSYIFSGIVLFLVIAIFIARIFFGAASYLGGFGTPHYVFVHGLWYPAGRDGKPRPGSVGTRTKPKPSSGGFGGGRRGGGFGGSGFGGGSHCACASSCACACACACAGGGRAGCSAKNLYGAVQLSKKLSEELNK